MEPWFALFLSMFHTHTHTHFSLSQAQTHALAFTDFLSSVRLQLLGYTHSTYGARPLSEIYPVIDNYVACWNVAGIFVDETPTSIDSIGYYQALYDYVKGKDPNLLVWLNPGTTPAEAYLWYSDTIMNYENLSVFHPDLRPFSISFALSDLFYPCPFCALCGGARV